MRNAIIVQEIDYCGIVAGIIDRIGLVEMINRAMFLIYSSGDY